MGPELFETFSESDIRRFKPFSGPAEEFSTRIRVYQTPFMYDNVEVGNYHEIDVCRGVEFKADDGFLTITEDRQIAAVTVVGSGCAPKGYNIVEWWEDGENIDNVDNKTVKRLRVDNLNGIHPSPWVHFLAGLPFMDDQDFDMIIPNEIKDNYDLLKKISFGFSDSLPLTFHENSAHFAVGQSCIVPDQEKFKKVGISFASESDRGPTSSFPRKITIRCGCREYEDAGTSYQRFADYSIRLVQVHLIV